MRNEKTSWNREEVDALVAEIRADADRKAATIVQTATADALEFFASVVEKLEFTNSDASTLEGAKLAQDKIAALARMAAERFREQSAEPH
jgi:hypothetical protein